MKTCKSCKESIEDKAYKCPKCQSFQVWYRSPYLILFVPLIFFFLFFEYMKKDRFEKVDFTDYKTAILTKQISQDTLTVGRMVKLNILIEVINNSDISWESAKYEIFYNSESGKILNVEKSSDFNFIIKPNEKKMSSIKVPYYEEYKDATLDIQLIDMRHDRF